MVALDKLTAITDHAKRTGRAEWQHTTHVAEYQGEAWTVATNGVVAACIKGGDLAAKDSKGDMVWEAVTRTVRESEHTVSAKALREWASVERSGPCPKCNGKRTFSHACAECELRHPFNCPACDASGTAPLLVVGKIGTCAVDLAHLRLVLESMPDVEAVGLTVDPPGTYAETVHLFAPGWLAAVCGTREDVNAEAFEIVEVGQ